MQFLKALFWFLILGLIAAFAFTNWGPVEIQLWSGLVADVNLPFLILVAFLLGLVPAMLIYHTVRWRLRARIGMLERTIEELRTAAHPPAPAAVATVDPGIDAEAPPLPPAAAPVVAP